MRTCSICGEPKSLSKFRVNPNAPDGRQLHCKVCGSEKPRLKPLESRYGSWTVIGEPTRTERRRTVVAVRCDCGTESVLEAADLRRGQTRSCGHETNREYHGGSGTRLYRIWNGMVARCTIPSSTGWSRYGARGVRVCDAWETSFITFRSWALTNGYDDSLTIDRIDSDGNYEPGNCRFVSMKEQGRNFARNRSLRAFGESKSIVEWSEDPRCAVGQKALAKRTRNGWDHERAISTPPTK